MLHFDQTFIQVAEAAGYKVHLYKRYVDDIVIVVESEAGFERGNKEQEEEVETKLAEEMRILADSIVPEMLSFEVDTPSQHENRHLPVLDLEVWVSPDNIILHSFYKKSMATRQVVMAKSALPASAKRAILVAEGVRRLKNCLTYLCMR